MNKNFELSSKNAINEVLEMFDLEPINDDDLTYETNTNIEIKQLDNSDSNNTIEVGSSKNRDDKFIKLILTAGLVVVTVFATLFISEAYNQNTNVDKGINNESKVSTENVGANEVQNNAEVKTAKNEFEFIEREFVNDPDVFVSYYGNINYHDMTLLYDEGELIAITPKVNNLFLMSEPKASSNELVNMYIKDKDLAGVIGIYNNYLHVYFPIDGNEYYGWVRMADVEFYNIDENSNFTYMTSDEFEKFISERQVSSYESENKVNESNNSNNSNDSNNSQTSPNSNSSNTNVENTATNTNNNASNYFTIGSTRDYVKSIMGNPSSMNQYTYSETWHYGFSTIEFTDGVVSGYQNYDKNLKIWLGDKVNNSVFSLRSSKQDVLEANGTPTGVAKYTYSEIWHYGFSTVEFTDGVVSGYQNYDKNLKVWLGEKLSNNIFSINSSKEDVLKANGTPTGVAKYTYSETWHYGFSTIEFTNNKVNGYHDYDNNLNVYLGTSLSGSKFGIGSSKQDVIHANGTPTGISVYTYSESWSYGFSTVEFNKNGIVESYNNWDNNLKISN